MFAWVSTAFCWTNPVVNYVSSVSQSNQKQETDKTNMKLAAPSVWFCSETNPVEAIFRIAKKSPSILFSKSYLIVHFSKTKTCHRKPFSITYLK